MKYLLIFLLALALVRFLNALVHLGRTGGRDPAGRARPRTGPKRSRRRIRDIEDAEFEIVPTADEEDTSTDS